MKIFYIIGTMLLIALVSGCKKDEIAKLSTPAPKVDEVTESTATIVWDAVENAASYTYTVNDGDEQSVTETKVLIEGLEAETEYTVKVKAVSGDTGLYTDSDWASVKVTTAAEGQSKTALATPAPQATEVSADAATISWEAVENAVSYTYTLNDGEETTVTETELSLGDLEAKTEYTLKLKADAGDSELYIDSEWAEVTFTTTEPAFEPTGYTVYPMDPMVVMEYANIGTSFIRNISPSGNYAVGYDNQLGDPTSFVWDLSTGEYTVLDPGQWDGCIAYDVNDNGIIVGSVVDGGYKETPAYMDFKNGGSWTTLPSHGLENAAYPSYAVAINNDGLIGGQIVTELSDGSHRCVPCLWKDYQLDQSAFDLPENGDAVMYGSFVYSMSDDGRILAGWQDWGIGSRSPAIWVDGKLTRIYGETELIGDEGYVYEGTTWGISPDGTKVSGYFMPDGMSLTGFIYDIATGEKTEIPSYGGVAFDNTGRAFFAGQMGYGGVYYENGQTKMISELWTGLEGTFATTIDPSVGSDGMLETVYSVSSDGKVFGGSYTYSAFGSAMQYPVIVVLE